MEGQRTGKLGPAEQQQLNSSLKVASASADAGQLEGAERLYTQLSRHFPSAPEPRLGLGYLALEGARTSPSPVSSSPRPTKDRWSRPPRPRRCSARGRGKPWHGEDTAAAKSHFLAASKLAKGHAGRSLGGQRPWRGGHHRG